MRNALRLPIPLSFARELNCFDPAIHTTSPLYPCLQTLAMGDNNAVELGQRAHVALGISARAFSASELLTAHSRGSRGHISAGVVIDDVLIAEQLSPAEATETSEGDYRLHSLFELYQTEGLTPHTGKTFRKSTAAEVWGAQLDGAKGWCRASLKRLVPLTDVTARIARLGVATVHLLEIIAGAWVAILQVRRRMLSLLQFIYTAQVGRQRHDIVRLSASLVAELWSLVILGPIAVANLRAQTLPIVHLSDASSNSIAVVSAPVSLKFARELHRHCLARGSWSRLLSPWKAYLREHDDLEDEVPDGVPLVCHPLWVALAEYLDYRVKLCKQVRRKQHINLLELEAVLKLEARLAERGGDLRYLLGSDSQVTLAALLKGRSSSWRVNRRLRASLGHHLGAGLYSSYGFVPSLSNVSDDPTRGKPVRPALTPLPVWLDSALQGNFADMDTWLAELGYDPLTVAKLPFPVGQKKVDSLISHIAHLRSVQKPERLAAFDKLSSEAPFDTVSPNVTEMKNRSFVSPFAFDHQKGQTRGQNKKGRPLGQEKIDTRGIKMKDEGPTQAVVSNPERREAPPANDKRSTPALPETPDRCPAVASHGRRRRCRDVRCNSRTALLTSEARQLLAKYPAAQFFWAGWQKMSGRLCPSSAWISGIFTVGLLVWLGLYPGDIGCGCFLSTMSTLRLKIS